MPGISVRSGRVIGTSPRTRIRLDSINTTETKRGDSRVDRQVPERFLLLDALGARRTHALNDQVEALLVAGLDVVVVDRGAQELASARRASFQSQASPGRI